jgi:hypothetical protein
MIFDTARGHQQMARDISAVTDDCVLGKVSGKKNTVKGMWNAAMVALTTHTCLLFVNQALLESKVWADGGTVKDAVLASS